MSYLKPLVLGILSLLWLECALAKAPSIDYQWLNFVGSQSECITTATQALHGSELTTTQVGAMTVVVQRGSYKGVISCFADHGLVVFTVAGTNYKAAEQLAKRLKALFDPSISQWVPSIDGVYPQASIRQLTYADLAPLSKWQLKVMRNEIFARHGYIFNTTAMKNYFNAQPWYQPKYYEVSHLLTPIEQSNVNFIKQYER